MVPGLPGYIVVEGPIGVGKTSLTRCLAGSFARSFVCCTAAPLLVANTAHIDRVDDEEVCQSLAERTHTARSGRHYFDPSLATD
jgi:thymidylate kinase